MIVKSSDFQAYRLSLRLFFFVYKEETSDLLCVCDLEDI